MKTTLIALALVAVLASCIPYYPAEKWPGRYTNEFLTWCIPKVDGVWEVDPTDCEPSDISYGQWDASRLPLSVNAEMPLYGEAQLAVIHWNDALGFEMFRWDEDEAMPDIVFLTAGANPMLAAEAKNVTHEGLRYGLVVVYNQWWERDDKKVAIHELGHLLGLRHDRSKHSLMYQGNEDKDAVIEQSDINALRWLYKAPLRTRSDAL